MPVTTSLPLSLYNGTGSPRDTVQNWMALRAGLPGSLAWTELCDEGAAPFMQASVNQPAAATMSFFTPWSNFQQYNESLLLSILGGYDQSNRKMCAPMIWPFDEGANDTMFATDVHVSTGFLDNSQQWVAGQPAAYRKAIYSITFQALPYEVNLAQGSNPYNPNWIEYKGQSSNQMYQAPPGEYIFNGGTFNGQIAINGTFYPTSSSYLEAVIHRMPASAVFTGGGQSVFQPYVGQVNSDSIWGWSAGQLLFDSIEWAPFGDWQGLNIYDVHLFFNAVSRQGSGGAVGWNTALAPDGNWYAIYTANGHNTPILTTSFSSNILGKIPAQE